MFSDRIATGWFKNSVISEYQLAYKIYQRSFSMLDIQVIAFLYNCIHVLKMS